MKELLYLMLALILSCGCSTSHTTSRASVLEKRHYNKGYSLNAKWLNGKQNNQEVSVPVDSTRELLSLTDGVSWNDDRSLRTQKSEELVLNQRSERADKAADMVKLRVQIKEDAEVNASLFTTSKEVSRQQKLYKKQDGSTVVQQPVTKVHGLAIAGFISAILSIFVGAIIFGPLAIIFCSIALSAIRKYPERYKGNGLAIAGMVIGVICTIIILIFFAQQGNAA